MAIRVEYEVRKLSDTYVTKEQRYSFVIDEKAPRGRFGEQRQKMVSEEVEVRGGYLYVIRGKPGHTVRLTSLDQIKQFGLGTSPKMIDANTGEEVDEHGVPKIVRRMLEVERTYGTMSGPSGTDIDVQSDAAEEDLSMGLDAGDSNHSGDDSVVDAAIAKLE
jgi:hypothetical protein